LQMGDDGIEERGQRPAIARASQVSRPENRQRQMLFVISFTEWFQNPCP
jgi:hypothetical protein